MIMLFLHIYTQMTVCMAARHHYTSSIKDGKKGPFKTKIKRKLHVSPGGCSLGLLTSVTSSPNHPQRQQENAASGWSLRLLDRLSCVGGASVTGTPS